MEAPLVKANPVLQEFAAVHRLKLSKNYHNEPERSLTWDTGIRRLIQLYLQDPKTLTLKSLAVRISRPQWLTVLAPGVLSEGPEAR